MPTPRDKKRLARMERICAVSTHNDAIGKYIDRLEARGHWQLLWPRNSDVFATISFETGEVTNYYYTYPLPMDSQPSPSDLNTIDRRIRYLVEQIKERDVIAAMAGGGREFFEKNPWPALQTTTYEEIGK